MTKNKATDSSDVSQKTEDSVWQKITDEEWAKRLSPEAYEVTRHKDTEPPFSGAFHNSKEEGFYTCICCGSELFSSSQKFISGCGWPSFWDARRAENIETLPDRSHGMERTEVRCKRCHAHLGHVFEDGPPPTHLRFCINSVALQFVPGKTDSERKQ